MSWSEFDEEPETWLQPRRLNVAGLIVLLLVLAFAATAAFFTGREPPHA